ncbi:hypothetical protein M0R45_008756 [Rubus argutus]|uniref:Uncharacterized protein n=1 Tax=Rubus argutus TaxID=59490 RepID=A0AAW1Y276_RUBAR
MSIPSTEILEVHLTNPSIKNSFGGMHWNPCHLEINRDLLMTLLESLPKKYPASSEEPRTNSFHGYCGLSSVDPVIYRQQRLSSRNSKLFRVLAHVSERRCCTYFNLKPRDIRNHSHVSVDEWRQFQDLRRDRFAKRPSGCLIRDLQNGSSFVTWVENVDVRDKTKLHPKLNPLLSLGMHLERGAGSQIFKFKPSASSTPRESTLHPVTPISPEGRRSLAITAKRMVARSSSFLRTTESSTISEIYRTDLSGNVYPPTALCMSLQPSVPVLTQKLHLCFGDKQTQRHPPSPGVFHDETGSFVIFASRKPFQSLLCGVDQEIQLMPFGFYILPNVSGSILDGTLLTMVFQITVKMSRKKAVEVATQIVKETLHKIIEAVN